MIPTGHIPRFYPDFLIRIGNNTLWLCAVSGKYVLNQNISVHFIAKYKSVSDFKFQASLVQDNVPNDEDAPSRQIRFLLS